MKRNQKGTVVVTGASTGIGRACALELAAMGFTVFAGVRKAADGESLEQAARESQPPADASTPGRLIPLILDVTDSESVASAVEKVSAELKGRGAGPQGAVVKGIDGLVNNAGIAVAGPLEFIPMEEFRRQLDVNVAGALETTQRFLPLLRLGLGRIVNMSSIAGLGAVPLLGPYCASKFALEALSEVLRMELRPWGLTVSVIEPGVIRTPIWRKSRSAAESYLDSLPPQAWDYYGPAMEAMQWYTEKAEETGQPVEKVVKAVAQALTAPRPRRRYVIGRDARARLCLERLPKGLRDFLLTRAVRLR